MYVGLIIYKQHTIAELQIYYYNNRDLFSFTDHLLAERVLRVYSHSCMQQTSHRSLHDLHVAHVYSEETAVRFHDFHESLKKSGRTRKNIARYNIIYEYKSSLCIINIIIVEARV